MGWISQAEAGSLEFFDMVVEFLGRQAGKEGQHFQPGGLFIGGKPFLAVFPVLFAQVFLHIGAVLLQGIRGMLVDEGCSLWMIKAIQGVPLADVLHANAGGLGVNAA